MAESGKTGLNLLSALANISTHNVSNLLFVWIGALTSFKRGRELERQAPALPLSS